MKKFVCSVCGYVHVGDSAPAECPVCHVGADKFVEQKEGEMEWAAEHVVGVAQGSSEDIMADLRANFEGECTEVGMYLAMARVAHREGYPEVGLYYEKAAWEQTPQRKTWNCVSMLKTALALVNSTWLNVLNWLTWMQSMTQYTKWVVTKLDTVKHSWVCITDTSNKNQERIQGWDEIFPSFFISLPHFLLKFFVKVYIYILTIIDVFYILI